MQLWIYKKHGREIRYSVLLLLFNISIIVRCIFVKPCPFNEFIIQCCLWQNVHITFIWIHTYNIKWMNFWRIMCLFVFLEIFAYDWWIAIVTRALLCRSGQYEHEWCHWARILRTKNNECLFIKNTHIPICKNLNIAPMIRKQIYLCEWLNWRQIIITSDSCSMEIGIH